MPDYERYQPPLWRLLPRSFWAAMNRQDGDDRCLRAYEALRAVIPMITLRRTQATIIEVNGVEQRIGDSIPPYRICTVELSWSNMEPTAYKKTFGVIKYLCHGIGPGGSNQGFTVPAGSKKGKPAAKGNTGAWTFAIHRALES